MVISINLLNKLVNDLNTYRDTYFSEDANPFNEKSTSVRKEFSKTITLNSEMFKKAIENYETLKKPNEITAKPENLLLRSATKTLESDFKVTVTVSGENLNPDISPDERYNFRLFIRPPKKLVEIASGTSKVVRLNLIEVIISGGDYSIKKVVRSTIKSKSEFTAENIAFMRAEGATVYRYATLKAGEEKPYSENMKLRYYTEYAGSQLPLNKFAPNDILDLFEQLLVFFIEKKWRVYDLKPENLRVKSVSGKKIYTDIDYASPSLTPGYILAQDHNCANEYVRYFSITSILNFSEEDKRDASAVRSLFKSDETPDRGFKRISPSTKNISPLFNLSFKDKEENIKEELKDAINIQREYTLRTLASSFVITALRLSKPNSLLISLKMIEISIRNKLDNEEYSTDIPCMIFFDKVLRRIEFYRTNPSEFPKF